MSRSRAAKIIRISSSGFVAGLLAAASHVDEVFEKPFRLESGGTVIDVNTGHAAPYLHDFDSDGVRDLLVGEFGAGSMTFEGEAYARGRLRIYRNTGTDKKPHYAAFEWFTAGGRIAQVPITCCVSFCPEVVDWEDDGDMDILTGSYPGHLYLYRNNGKGEYDAAEMLRDRKGEPVKPATSSNPRVHDWDGDGDLDLVIGHSRFIHVVRNIGTREAPTFESGSSRVKYRGQEIRLRGRLGVEMADWNRDGRTDLLIGQSAGVTVLFNSAPHGEPVFTSSCVLIRSRRGMNDAGMEGTDYPGGRLKLHVADYNGDGIDDLLVGDVYSPQPTRLRDTLTEEQKREYEAFRKKNAALRNEITRLATERDLSLDGQARMEMQERIMHLLDQLGNDYYGKEREYLQQVEAASHGHVWVYLRKDGPAGPNAAVHDAFHYSPPSGRDGLTIRAGVRSDGVQAGVPFLIRLRFELEEDCKTYGGIDSSVPEPTTFDFDLPQGFRLVKVHWPEPQGAETIAKGTPAVGTYTKDFVVTATVAPPQALPKGRFEIRILTNWQVCRNDVCTLGASYSRLRFVASRNHAMQESE